MADIVISTGGSHFCDNYSAPFDSRYPFDGQINSNFWTGGSQIGYILPSSRVCNKYGIIPRSTYYNTPNSWTLEGYNGTSWVTLDSRSGITSWTDYVFNYYTINNTTAYQQYRITFGAQNAGYGENGGFGISEIQFIEVVNLSQQAIGGF